MSSALSKLTKKGRPLVSCLKPLITIDAEVTQLWFDEKLRSSKCTSGLKCAPLGRQFTHTKKATKLLETLFCRTISEMLRNWYDLKQALGSAKLNELLEA